jgi:predicted acyl esterase
MGGYQQLVRGEPFRGKFRTGFDNPQPFTPGKVERIEFELPDTFHAFRRGHRVMVQVQSSWFPLVDRNPQKFLKIHEARSEDFVKATHRVHRSAQAASQIVLPVLP